MGEGGREEYGGKKGLFLFILVIFVTPAEGILHSERLESI